MRFIARSFVGGFAAALAGLALAVSAASAQTIKIGSKNFTEQFIVAELYAAALEGAGFKVERKINLGGTLVVRTAPGQQLERHADPHRTGEYIEHDPARIHRA